MSNQKNTTENLTKNKAIKLFTYLESVLQLDDKVDRDFKKVLYENSVWWRSDFPSIDNLKVRSFSSDSEDEDGAVAWLRVEKKKIPKPPVLPKILTEWVSEESLKNPQNSLFALDKISRKVNFSDDKEREDEFKKFCKSYRDGDEIPEALLDWVTINLKNGPEKIDTNYVDDYFSDHQELGELLNKYKDNEWNDWAKDVLEIYKANTLYDQLYALRLSLKNQGDNYELLWGHGILSWDHPTGGEILWPTFLSPVVIEFNAINSVIEIHPDPLYKSFVELSPLHELDHPAEVELITWADKINTDPFDFWNYEQIKRESKWLISNLSPDCEDLFDKDFYVKQKTTENPTFWNSQTIFARKRSNSLWAKYAGLIRRDIEQNDAEPTDFIADLVGEYNKSDINKELENFEEGNVDEIDAPLKDGELYFPLPWNEEQKNIAERIEASYGVVVKGPPGTGKSHTIANLVSRFLAQGKTVLVTSQTSKALEVLREKLPESIQSLAVSQLGQNAKTDQVLQTSISEISANLNEKDKFNKKVEDGIRFELDELRKKKSALASRIRDYILIDSTASIEIDGKVIQPIEAARTINENEESGALNWFEDDVPYDLEINFSETDLKEFYENTFELGKECSDLWRYALPNIDILPKTDLVVEAFKSYKILESKNKKSKGFFDEDIKFNQDELRRLCEVAENAIKVLEICDLEYEKHVFKSCYESAGQRTKWLTIINRAKEKLNIIQEADLKLIGIQIDGANETSHDDNLAAISELVKATENNKKITTLKRLLLSQKAKNILDSYKVNDCTPDSFIHIEYLKYSFLKQKARHDIDIIISQELAKFTDEEIVSFSNLSVLQLENFIKNLEIIVGFYDQTQTLIKFTQEYKTVSHFDVTSIENIRDLQGIINSYLTRFELNNLDDLFGQWIKNLDSEDGIRHPVVDQLLQAVENKDGDSWSNSFEVLLSLKEKQRLSEKAKEIKSKLSVMAPLLGKKIEETALAKKKFAIPNNLNLAWRVQRYKSWLDNIHGRTNIQELQSQHEIFIKQEQDLNAQLVSVLAWQRQIARVTDAQKQALMAWALYMKKVGKMQGKYWRKHLKDAQDALFVAKDAVPVWIMPLSRVVQMFPNPKAGMFDVVIFDEASQCDIKGITVGYLGKKLLVVGDPDQISPAGMFQNMEKVFDLVARYLSDIPEKGSFATTSSLFDIAHVRLPNSVMLLEHFRCVPEIIAFSKHYIYENKIKPLRYPQPKGLLSPALVPVYVENGYQNKNNKVNIPEAEAILKKLQECLADPKYDKRPNGELCTFGIISLLAEDQAKYIKDLVLKNIDQKIIEDRRIDVGDAYTFQGDERDVMFLSMVKALDSDKLDDTVRALADENTKRRFNVAASRARDQMFLFHSIPLSSFTNQEDWRWRLLNWFYNPQTETLKAGLDSLEKEVEAGRASPFSYAVGKAIIERGYQVIPEFPVIGYRIDLVIQGENARLAVECDGDQYHTLERWDNDQVREAQLRRAGWEFWRVTGSSYYRHKEQALESLWEKLDKMGIKPMI
jgi:hypothetical protein